MNNQIVLTPFQHNIVSAILSKGWTKYAKVEGIGTQTMLDLLTIARLVSGESYLVRETIEVGDLVFKEDNGSIYEVTPCAKRQSKLPNTLLHAVQNYPEKYILVSKKKDRKDI